MLQFINMISKMLHREMRNDEKLIKEIQGDVIELAKSVVHDAELMKFRPSLVAAGVYMAVAELGDHNTVAESLNENLKKLFGGELLAAVKDFGFYVILRQRQIFEEIGPKFVIYSSERSLNFYTCKYFDSIPKVISLKNVTDISASFRVKLTEDVPIDKKVFEAKGTLERAFRATL